VVHAAQVLRIARLVDQLAHLPLYRQAFAPAVNPAVELLLDPQEHELSVGVAVVVAAAAPSFDDRRRVGANGGRIALLNRRVPRPLVQWVAHQDLQNR